MIHSFPQCFRGICKIHNYVTLIFITGKFLCNRRFPHTPCPFYQKGGLARFSLLPLKKTFVYLTLEYSIHL